MSEPPADRDSLGRVRCRHCHDVIGAYEPMVLETHRGRSDTSLAADPGLYETDLPCFHRTCYDQAPGQGG
jgi:hypothetical protein